MKPEEQTRLKIDDKLIEVGYEIQDFKNFNPAASLGVAVREFPTNSGPVDYLLFINKVPVGVVEAKRTEEGQNLVTVAEQSLRYVKSGLKYISNQPKLRFAYEATDIIVRFCDYADEKAKSREVFTFHKPEVLLELLQEEDTLRNRLKKFPKFDSTGFRKCQTIAIENLEKSFQANKPRALIQMATGAGKTFTAISAVYRLLKYGKAKRILFLVDTKNLGEQAEEEFRKYKPNDDSRLFPELYNVVRLNSSSISEDTHVCISTIQRMYSILRGEALDENSEEISPSEIDYTHQRPKEVMYNSKYSPDFFDFIFIDECHRSIYNVWQQVLDYFDAFLIGLTATPDNRTFAFFNQNIVSEYTHEEAVIDDVNVGRQGTYIIETEIGQNGAIITKDLVQTIQIRERLSRKKRWTQLDEDIDYKPSQLDADIVNPSQIRSIIRIFKEKVLTEMFPGREEVPKTLIFAKTDSHANDIIDIVRDEFGEGNEFCKKITYGSDEDPKSILNSFRNDYYPRIAVTVDMIATGTDVKPLECLIFMRDVRSKNYFEQMLGRATRTLNYDDLHKVSPSAKERKKGYILVDAVGVTKSQKTTSRQLERKPSISIKQLMNSIAIGEKTEDNLTSLANRFLLLDKTFEDNEKEEIEQLSNGLTLRNMATNLLNAFDEDQIEMESNKEEYDNYSEEEKIEKAKMTLIEKAVEPIYNPKLRQRIYDMKKTHDQIIDDVNIDTVIYAGWNTTKAENAQEIINSFHNFIEENKNEIEALEIIYNQMYKNRPITYKMINDLYDKLTSSPYYLTRNKLWSAYEELYPNKVKSRIDDKLADILSLIKFELGQNDTLQSFASLTNNKFKKWIFYKNSGYGQFTEEQMDWLRKIRDHISLSMHIEKGDLELTPFNNMGGLQKYYQLFGNNYEIILEELNYALVA